ncbi:MAG: hypothetical protein J0H48_12520 [Nitrosospira multiformis]|nr:hypothetical protein [Nitrosospira multiformis]
MDMHGKAWVLGFLTALNLTSSGKKDVLAVVDADTIYTWIDRYCVENPKSDTPDAAVELFLKLRKIAK